MKDRREFSSVAVNLLENSSTFKRVTKYDEKRGCWDTLTDRRNSDVHDGKSGRKRKRRRRWLQGGIII